MSWASLPLACLQDTQHGVMPDLMLVQAYETAYGMQQCSRKVCPPGNSIVAISSDLVLLRGMTGPPVQIEPSVGATTACWCSAHRRTSSQPSSSSIAFRHQEKDVADCMSAFIGT